MKIPANLRELIEQGEIGRGPYLAIGLILTALKYGIDASVAYLVFSRTWTPWDYLISGSTLSTVWRFPEDQSFFLTLFAISIPFVAIGVMLTLARLRSADANPWMVILFFLPVANLVLISVLVVVEPSRTAFEKPPDPIPQSKPISPSASNTLSYGTDTPAPDSFFRRIFPESRRGSAWVAATLTAAIAVLMTWLSVEVLASYGWGVFVLLPFLSGLISSVLFGIRHPRSLKDCLAVASLTILILAAAVILAAIDGAVCVLMYLPLAIPISLLGACVGYSFQRGPLRTGGAGAVIAILLAMMPLFLGAERAAHPRAPVFRVVTSCDIDAPPQRVWQNVIAFSEIPPPTEWIFRAGVAYPIRAVIDGRGVGAVRHCVFSTGEFVEPITAWQAPRLLKFNVTSDPPPMKEWSPYDIHPPHVHDFLISFGGQFRLIPLPGGRTRLEGTTWYEHNMWPASYWRLWSDFLIHRIHRRVLEHIKQISESQHQI